ncbi:MAG: hypothetical protein DRJ56_07685 [Thermoprotei archaeon]|nr:MAG: hypothetical protein DRJ56_07685 [Thermoprotei archaeon]
MRSKPVVYFGSVQSSRPTPEDSIAGKYLEIIRELGVREAVKGKLVAIKMHVGKNLGFSTVNPLLVRLLVREIKRAGGTPYVIDVPEQIPEAHARGYVSEVIGCPIVPVAGFRDEYYVEREVNYRALKSLKLGGNCKDADVLVVLSHVKGHNTAGFGASIKNVALGCYTRDTRAAMHRCTQYPRYWFPERCGSNADEVMRRLADACPHGAIRVRNGELRVVFDMCNQCMRCTRIAPGCIRISPENFNGFFEAMAMAAKFVLEQFDEDGVFFINVALDMTELCDCWGFTTGNVLPDLGVLGSRDILAVDKATLDLTNELPLIVENVSRSLEVIDDPDLHPFARIFGPYKDPYLQIYYGEKYGLGEVDYELVEVRPARRPERKLPPPSFPRARRLYPRVRRRLSESA